MLWLDQRFNWIAGWAGIIGTLLSIWLLIAGARISARLNRQLKRFNAFKNFEREQKQISAELKAIIDLITEDNIADRRLKSDTFKLLGRLDNYEDLFTDVDRKRIEELRKTLSNAGQLSASDKDMATMILSGLIGKLKYKGVFLGD